MKLDELRELLAYDSLVDRTALPVSGETEVYVIDDDGCAYKIAEITYDSGVDVVVIGINEPNPETD